MVPHIKTYINSCFGHWKFLQNCIHLTWSKFCILGSIAAALLHEKTVITSLISCFIWLGRITCPAQQKYIGEEWRHVLDWLRKNRPLYIIKWWTTNPLLSSKLSELSLKALSSYKTKVPCQCNTLLWGFVWVNKMKQRRWKNDHRASRGTHSHIWGKGIG